MPSPVKFDGIKGGVFEEALRSELAIIGGNFSLTVEPFTIRSPAPYITSVMGISSPFDCD